MKNHIPSHKRGLLFCGDVVATSPIKIDSKLQELLRAHISFCNLEAPVLPSSYINNPSSNASKSYINLFAPLSHQTSPSLNQVLQTSPIHTSALDAGGGGGRRK